MRANFISPVLRRVNAYTSVEWPIFWRARYERAVLLLIAMTVFAISLPMLTEPLERLTGTQTATGIRGIAAILVLLCMLGLSIWWLVRPTQLVVPSHAIRAVAAPSLAALTLFIYVFLVLAYIIIVKVNKSAPLLQIMRDEGFIGSDKLSGWQGCLLTAFAIALVFRLRNIFGLGLALGSLALALLCWSLAGAGLVGFTKILDAINVTPATSSEPWKSMIEIVMALLVTMLLSAPAFRVYQSFRRNVRLSYSRVAVATLAWSAPYIVGGFLVMIAMLLTAIGKLVEVTPQSLGLVFPEVAPATTTTSIVLLLTAGYLTTTEYIARLAARLLTLPEA